MARSPRVAPRELAPEEFFAAHPPGMSALRKSAGGGERLR